MQGKIFNEVNKDDLVKEFEKLLLFTYRKDIAIQTLSKNTNKRKILVTD